MTGNTLGEWILGISTISVIGACMFPGVEMGIDIMLCEDCTWDHVFECYVTSRLMDQGITGTVHHGMAVMEDNYLGFSDYLIVGEEGRKVLIRTSENYDKGEKVNLQLGSCLDLGGALVDNEFEIFPTYEVEED